jgi:hypothetical protein
MWLKKEVSENLVGYHDRVRQTIGNLDTLVVDVLARGATLVIALLVAPWSLTHVTGTGSDQLQAIARGAFYVSLAAVAAASYVTFAVSLYADLLKRAVHVGNRLEQVLFDKPSEQGLTTVLDGNFFAAGKAGRYLYLLFAIMLYIGAAGASYVYDTWADKPVITPCTLAIGYAGLIIFIVCVVVCSWYLPIKNSTQSTADNG